MEMEKNQEKLIEMIVDKVFHKHKVKVESNNLSDEEKEELKNVVGNIKKDVERFLENQSKTKTEKDFESSNQTIAHTQVGPKKRPTFTQPNDTKAVKNFLSKKKF